jgi:quercetin dioxygenase-like cupin family protein
MTAAIDLGRRAVIAIAIAAAGGCAGAPRAATAPTASAASAAPAASTDDGIRRTLVGQQDLPDVPGWETRVVLVEYAPGAAAPSHTHPATGIGYVLSGRFESQFGDEPIVTHGAGESFLERSDAPHRLFRNPDATRPLRFLVTFTLRKGEPALRPWPPTPAS